MGSLHTSYKLHVQLNKDLSYQHAFGQRCTKITGFEGTLLDGSLTPEVGIVESLHISYKLHVQLYKELLDLTKVLNANMLTCTLYNVQTTFFCRPAAHSILIPPTFPIASLNRYTPNFSGVPQKLTWCQQFGLQIFPN